MPPKLTKGVELLEETEGEGCPAGRGMTVIYNARLFLRRGDEVPMDERILGRAREHVTTRLRDGVELIDHVTLLGKRRTIAGIETSLYGMKKGGYREVMVAPHLAYGEKGIEGLVPANALLRIQIWVQQIQDHH